LASLVNARISLAYVRASARLLIDVSTTPSPLSSSSAIDQDNFPPVSPKASYRTIARCWSVARSSPRVTSISLLSFRSSDRTVPGLLSGCGCGSGSGVGVAGSLADLAAPDCARSA
jgi:hypothetical protein